jgi:predicted lipid carrier protein YhbT
VPAARELATLAIADARRVQGLSPAPPAPPASDAAPPSPGATDPMHADRPADHAFNAVLRLLPPPARWAPLLRALPANVQQRLLERAIAGVLAIPAADGSLDFMEGRHLGIEVTDLGLRWVVGMRDGVLRAGDGVADASVRGTATDLLLLSSRLEDADSLFFQRRLVLTGDTELGLTARNVLERLPWESVPLALRIVLNRGARLARQARDARARKSPAA